MSEDLIELRRFAEKVKQFEPRHWYGIIGEDGSVGDWADKVRPTTVLYLLDAIASLHMAAFIALEHIERRNPTFAHFEDDGCVSNALGRLAALDLLDRPPSDR